jgi:hypothetical protein
VSRSRAAEYESRIIAARHEPPSVARYLPKLQLIESLVFCLLVSDVLSHGLLVAANRGHEVAVVMPNILPQNSPKIPQGTA